MSHRTFATSLLLALVLMLAAGASATASQKPDRPNKGKPGARTLGDPLFPQIGNGGYDALHYDIALDYDRAANVFTQATTTMTAKARQHLSEFSLDFQDLPVHQVLVDGVPAELSQVEATPDLSEIPEVTQPMKLVVTPAVGVRKRSRFEVTVSYSGQPQVITDPDESIEGWIPACYTVAMVTTCDSVFVVGAPIGSQGWFPSNNHPSDKATFDTAITVATGEQAFGAGELTAPPVDNGDGTTTWSWSEDDLTSTYLVSASNGRFDYSQTTVTEAMTGRTMPVHNAVDPSATAAQKASIAALIARNGEMIDFFGPRYGPFPFDSYGIVYDRAPNVGYAIEMQTKSHFSSLPSSAPPDGFAETLYLHELEHSWFGNSVTAANWSDIWHNEGWTVFSEWIFRHETGRSATTPAQRFADNYASGPEAKWEIAPAVLDGDPANVFSGFPVYIRGAMTVAGYMEIVGRERFYAFSRAIHDHFGYGNISTEQFIALAKRMSGLKGHERRLLDEYFEQWLYGETKPTIIPASFD